MTFKLAFDENHDLSYGYYRCEACGITMFAGGMIYHGEGCANAGKPAAESFTFVIGERCT